MEDSNETNNLYPKINDLLNSSGINNLELLF